MHGRFAECARLTPDVVAVECEEHRLTYRELNERANQLAHYLRRTRRRTRGRGRVLRGARVGGDRGDARHVEGRRGVRPARSRLACSLRLSFMLDDTRAPVLLTQRRLLDRLPAYDGTVVCLDDEPPAWAREPIDDPPDVGQLDGLAYVIYTSGSTGDPKGVAVGHRGILRLTIDADYLDVRPSDTVAQFSVPWFDASAMEIWGALLNGARLVHVAKDALMDAGRMAEAIRVHGITAMVVITAPFNQLASQNPEVFAPLRVVVFGGEAVDPRWVREVLDHGCARAARARLRPDREHRVRHLARGDRGAGAGPHGADRPAGRGHPRVGPRPTR